MRGGGRGVRNVLKGGKFFIKELNLICTWYFESSRRGIAGTKAITGEGGKEKVESRSLAIRLDIERMNTLKQERMKYFRVETGKRTGRKGRKCNLRGENLHREATRK